MVPSDTPRMPPTRRVDDRSDDGAGGQLPESSDESFSRQLYDRYAAPLLSSVMRLTEGDRYWAEDVVQETLLRAWRNSDRLHYGEDRSLLPWLVTVARRIVIDDLRHRRIRSQELSESAHGHLLTADDTEQGLQRMLIKTALAELSPAHREAIMEVYFRGRTVAQVAKLRGIPLGTAKSRIYYALRALRHTLRDLGIP